MKSLSIIALVILIYGCASKQNSETTDSKDSVAQTIVASTDSINYLKVGFDIMRDEKFESLQMGISSDEVIKLIGVAESKSEVGFSEVAGMNWQTWFYPTKGFEISFYQNDDQTWSVVSYLLKETSTYKSTRGIGIGSTAEEVRQAYINGIGTDEGSDQIIVGTLYGGIVFWMTNGKVRNIYVGVSAE